MGIPNFDDQLTQAEKDAKNFLCWSNETLGKCVRWTAQKIKDNNGKDALYINSALLVLQFGMKNANAETLKTIIVGDTKGKGWKLEAKLKLTERRKKNRTENSTSTK